MSKRTIKCRMLPNPAMADSLAATCRVFADACNAILKVAIENKITNRFRLHGLTYADIRAQFPLTANLAVRAIARVSAAMLAAQRRKHKPASFLPSSVSYDARIFAYRPKDETVSLSTVNGRIHVPLLLGEYQRQGLKDKIPTAATVLRQGKKWYINIVVEDVDDPRREGPPLGIDLGIRNIATLSTGMQMSGKATQAVKQHFEKVRASCQSKGTRGSKRLLKRLSGKEWRTISWWNHNVSKRVVTEAVDGGFGIIRMEDLRGIRERTRTFSKRLNRMVAGWSFAELQAFVSYKAIRRGIAVEFVNPAYTSQVCHRCGSKGIRNQSSFTCTTCGVQDADRNASLNIAGGGVCKPPRIDQTLESKAPSLAVG